MSYNDIGSEMSGQEALRWFVRTAEEMLEVDPYNIKAILALRYVRFLSNGRPNLKELPEGRRSHMPDVYGELLLHAEYSYTMTRMQIETWNRRISAIRNGRIQPASAQRMMKPIDPNEINRKAELEAKEIQFILDESTKVDALLLLSQERVVDDKHPIQPVNDEGSTRKFEEHVKDDEYFKQVYGEYWLHAKRKALNHMQAYRRELHRMLLTDMHTARMIAEENTHLKQGMTKGLRRIKWRR